MKIFGICASPRNNTTEYVLKKALDSLEARDRGVQVGGRDSLAEHLRQVVG